MKMWKKVGKSLFKFGKKASADKDKEGASAFEWPAGLKIGIFGHTNSGKTTYYTVLNEESKISRNLQISVTDNATSNEFLVNRRAIWGLGTTSEVGTVVDLRGEQKFPNPTAKDRLLIFNAILDGSKKVPVVCYDYTGKAISITSSDELKDKVADFMASCDGLLFFYDPKVMGSELESQAHVASFVSTLESLAPGSKRLPIPIGLVITKADVLPGFDGESKVTLIGHEDEQLLSEDFDLFLNKLLTSGSVASDSAWAGSVRKVLVRLSDFLKVVVGRTLNFQIFFISNTGTSPEKVGTDVGRSLYKPPEKIHPTGVKDPFYWILGAVLRNRGIKKVRALAKVIATVSIIWVIAYSVPFLYHFNYTLPQAEFVEREILKANSNQVFSISKRERGEITREYRKYQNTRLVKYLFREFKAPAGKIVQFYTEFDASEAVKQLDKVITRLTTVVNDSAYWPKVNPSDSLEMLPELERIITELNEFHAGEEGSELYQRSDRVLRYWELFTGFLVSRDDSAAANTLQDQVKFNTDNYRKELSPAEKSLGTTLAEKVKVKATARVRKQASETAVVALDDFIDEINGNDNPEYRLEKAVNRLRRLKSDLTDGASVKAVNQYISDARKWTKTRTFKYKIESVPDNSHLHIEVTDRGENPTWAATEQFFEGDYTLEWKMNQDVHISYDAIDHECNWGKSPSDKIVLKGKYSLFEMEGTINFGNITKQVSISFNPELAGQLPILKK